MIRSTSDQQQTVYWETEHGFRPYNHPTVKLFAEQRLAYLNQQLDLSKIRSALDVGCGDGFSTFYVAQKVNKVWALDRSRLMLGRHPLRKARRLAAGDITRLPYQDNSFDLVYAWEVLHHLSAPRDAVAEMMRVSREYVLLIEPNRNNPAQFIFALLDPEHRWVLRYSLRFLSNLARDAGLEIVHDSTGGYIFPNRTPEALAPVLARLPYKCPIGISNWVLARKRGGR